MKHFLVITLALALISCSGGKISPLPETWETGQYDQLSEIFDSRIQKMMKGSMVKGVSLSVVDGQETVWATGFGWANEREAIPADEHTIYRFGSITKLFTATAIMDLVEQGRIDLNAPIQTYLPEMKINSHGSDVDTIRVRHLLTHHSGLPGDRMGGFGFYKPLDEDYHQEYLKMPEYLSNDYIQLGPDSVYAYCNNAFTLLGVIIQRVSGLDYSEYMQKEILDPMEMNHSGLIMTPDLESKAATGYQMNRELAMPYIRDLPAGSILSSSSDMAEFMKMVLNEGVTATGDTLLFAETQADMLTRKNSHVPLDKNFSIGWTYWLVNPYDHEFEQHPVGHGGDIPPFHAIMVMLPGEKLGVTVVTNSNTGTGMITPLAIDLMKAAFEIKTGQTLRLKKKAEEAGYDRLNYENLEGYYVGPAGLTQVRAGKKGLSMSMGSLKLGLVPHVNDEFSVKLKIFGFITLDLEALDPLRVMFFESGGVPHMDLTMGGVSAGTTSRIEPVTIPDIWKKRAGKYERTDPFTPFTKDQYNYSLDKPRLKMDKKSGFLLLEGTLFGAPMQLPLKPLDETTAVIMGVGRMGGQTVSILEQDGKEVLQWSGMQFSKR